jgi:predicted RNase H-like nuclease (RuvC/YqgF family)
MAQPSEPFRLHSELVSLARERDAAVATSEALARENEAQRRQLVAEQDRFVSHLIEAHERDVKHLREELAASREAVARLSGEVIMARAMLDDAMSGAATPRFQSVQPASGPLQNAAPPESGIVGRLSPRKNTRANRR